VDSLRRQAGQKDGFPLFGPLITIGNDLGCLSSGLELLIACYLFPLDNCIKVLTEGYERALPSLFFCGGKIFFPVKHRLFTSRDGGVTCESRLCYFLEQGLF